MERVGQMLEATLPPGVMVMAVRGRVRREVCLPSGATAMFRSGCLGLWSYGSQGLC